MSDRVLRGHRVRQERGFIGWRERRRRADRLVAQHRANGRWANIPEDRLPVRRFTITPEDVWGQPGGHSSDEALSVRICRGEESDAA